MKVSSLLKGWSIVALATFVFTATNLSADDDVPVKDLPKEVTDAIKAKFPQAEIISAEKETDDGKVYYEVKIRDQQDRWEIDVTREGKVLDIDKKD